MVDPVRRLLDDVEEALGALPGARLGPAAGAEVIRRFEEATGRKPPPGLAAFLARHDGAQLGPDVRLLRLDESLERWKATQAASGPKGLWMVIERGERWFALDAEAGDDGEWPVVEVIDRTVDRAGSTYLRFLLVLAAELTATDDRVALARQRCAMDPWHGHHWLTLAELCEEAGQAADADAALLAGARTAAPPTPALMLALAMRRLDRDERTRARADLEDALALDAMTVRDDEARLDAAALLLVLGGEVGDTGALERARTALGDAAAGTAGFWRVDALAALASGDARRAKLALDVVAALVPDDADLPRLRAAGGPETRGGLRALITAREALDSGRYDDAEAQARTALTQLPELALAHAFLAESLNAQHSSGAEAAARKATELNPILVDAWRELGDARLERSDMKGAEEAYRRLATLDGAYGLAHAKLAQALLELGRATEALQHIQTAAERGGDPFFVSAIRGDILAELERHNEAAEAYDEALTLEPDDHWALHQAAVEHSLAGNADRATDLFEAALKHDDEGCHQTLIDYANLLRRIGRIGDAVKLYRKAVAAVPYDPEWKQALKDAEKELAAAPN